MNAAAESSNLEIPAPELIMQKLLGTSEDAHQAVTQTHIKLLLDLAEWKYSQC